jgi:hypothetical protein
MYRLYTHKPVAWGLLTCNGTSFLQWLPVDLTSSRVPLQGFARDVGRPASSLTSIGRVQVCVQFHHLNAKIYNWRRGLGTLRETRSLHGRNTVSQAHAWGPGPVPLWTHWARALVPFGPLGPGPGRIWSHWACVPAHLDPLGRAPGAFGLVGPGSHCPLKGNL